MKRLSLTLRSYAIPLLVLALGLGVTQFVAWRVKQLSELRRSLQFQTAAAQMSHAIRARVEIYTSLLRGSSGMLRNAATRTVSDFGAYVAALELSAYYPGIQGIGFAELTAFGPGPEYVSYQRDIGNEVVIWPDRDEGIGFPIVLLEPGDTRNLHAIGFDMFSEPVRREAMERAWRTGRAAASGRVTLVQEIDEDKQAGFLIYLPVFADNGNQEPTLLGFAYSPFRVHDLFDGILQTTPLEPMYLEIYDGQEVSPANQLHASSTRPVFDEQDVLLQRIEVAGRPWTLRFIAELDHDRSAWLALGVSAAGATLTALLVLLILGLERSRAASERHAQALAASEQAAKDNERLMQAILDAAIDAIITIDHEGNIVEYNPAAERMFGYAREAVLGRNLLELILPSHSLDDAQQELQREFTAGAGMWVGRRVEVTARREDGEPFPVEVAISRVELRGRPLFTAYLRDITERRRTESQLEEFNAGLERRVQQRTAELQDANQQLEAFSYSVSHDLRAPARHVLGFSELLQRQLTASADASAQRLVRVITDSARRMAQLIDDLLAFSRTSRQEFRRGSVVMDELVVEVRRRLAPEMVNRQIEWEVEPLPVVQGDRALLTQVWTNLIANAIKYTRRRDVATIRIRAEVTAEEKIFEITDNGTGFDMAYAHKLFGVFQRLHRDEEFEGTGIGLANVARIIQRHGGRVWALGEPGVGASFFFALPRNVAEQVEGNPSGGAVSSTSPFNGGSDSADEPGNGRSGPRPQSARVRADG